MAGLRAGALGALVTAMAAALCVVPAAPAAAGTAPRFVVEVDLPGNDFVFGLTTMASGHAVVGITSDRGAWLAMLHPDGRFVRGFGDGGVRSIGFGGNPDGLALFRTRDDAVAVLAVTRSATDPSPSVRQFRSPRLVIAKVLADGARDPTFGTGGVATASLTNLRLADYAPVAAAEAPDGSIVVLVVEGTAGYFGGALAAGLVRFSPQGALDRSFGVRGVMPVSDLYAGYAGTAPIGGFGVDGLGRILIGDLDVTGAPLLTSARVRRLTPAGMPDPTFGVGGTARADFAGEWESPVQLIVERGGTVTCFGYSADGTFTSAARAAAGRPTRDGFAPGFVRLRSDGRLDRSFGHDGRSAIRKTAEGDVLDFAGRAVRTSTGSLYGTASSRNTTVVFRLTAAGHLDPSFANRGTAITPAGGQGYVTAAGGTVMVAGVRNWSSGTVVIVGYFE